MRLLIAGIPVDDATNRAHAARLGLHWITMPPLPRNLARSPCEACGGRVVLDPDSEQIRHSMTAPGPRADRGVHLLRRRRFRRG